MTTTKIIPQPPAAANHEAPTQHGLSTIVVDLLRLVRTLRAEYCAANELLVLAIEMLGEQAHELDRVRDRYHQLLNEQRGTTKRRDEGRAA